MNYLVKELVQPVNQAVSRLVLITEFLNSHIQLQTHEGCGVAGNALGPVLYLRAVSRNVRELLRLLWLLTRPSRP
jgi:hypothetical protein